MKIICSWEVTMNSLPGALDGMMAPAVALQRLGHEVYLMQEFDPEQCWDANYNPVSFAEWEGWHQFESLTKSYGIWPRCCLIYSGGEATHGMSFRDAVKAAETSDLLLRIGGRLMKTADIFENVRVRAYVDGSPGKTQVYHSVYGVDYGFDRYHYFFTMGLNIGTPKCEIPTCGVTWHGYLTPVDLSVWPATIDERCHRFTTISSWAGRPTFNFQGRFSGEKADQWQRFIELPRKTGEELEIALDIHPNYREDIQVFTENGWLLSDPKQLRSLDDYRGYIARSRAEFSVANNRYVQFRTGWFSERSARYLASGKPVLVQSAGVEDHLPTGKGLLTFTTLDEAIAGIGAINKDYLGHCRAAREIAEEYFDAEKVLSTMLKQMGF